MNLNKVFVLGNLTRDPETRSLPSGQPVVSFGLATNRFFTSQSNEKQQETEFHNITLFGRLAEIASQYLKKGSLVLIEGRIRTRNWADRNNPDFKHYRTEIICERMQLGPKPASQSQANFQSQQKPLSAQTEQKTIIKNAVADEEIPIIEEKPVAEPEPSIEPEKTDRPDDGEINVKDIPF